MEHDIGNYYYYHYF